MKHTSIPKFKQGKLFFWLLWVRSLLLGAISTAIAAIPAEAAERINFNYGPLALSIRVDSLEQFAKDGTVNEELAFYLGDVTPEQREQFRQALLQRSEIDPVQLYRFFRTPIGEDILEGIGTLIQVPGGSNGKYPIRGTLFEAANDPEGLTVLNFLRKFPTDIQLDTDAIFDAADKIEGAVNATNALVEDVGELSASEAQQDNVTNFANLPDLRLPGTYGFEAQLYTVTDASRDRTFALYIYKPQRMRSGKTPVVIISHGLASRPEDFARRAEHLASHGFLVALPQHPGSDYNHFQGMLNGYYRDIFDLNEFINRPRDISFVIDELERRNNREFGGRLDLTNVGVYGHSFGGYTALAVAGAQIDFNNLEAACNGGNWDPNLSLLLQCRALDLPRQAYNFRDDRVTAIMAFNPVNSVIFGSQGLARIQIPVFIAAGSYDPATPAVFEQLRSFPWLNAGDRYLALAEGQAHVDFSQLDAGASQLLNSLPNLTFPDPVLIDNYANAISLAFFETYITNNDRFRPYLQASYSAYLSRGEKFKLFLVDAEASDAIAQALDKFNLNDR